MNQLQRKMNSKIGPLYLVASAKGLQGVFWSPQAITHTDESSSAENTILNNAERQLKEYLEGKRMEFDLPLDPIGTEFQKKVWKQLVKIPYGETRSYKEIARGIKNENACRAVGTANGRNPLSIIVPCHRVIQANGATGGYAGGVNIKEILLSLEKKRKS